MAQFVPFADGIEVNGTTILSTTAALGQFGDLAADLLAEQGIRAIDAQAWYPQGAWLAAFRNIAEEIGPSTLFTIGTKIPENAEWPPHIVTIQDGLASIDIAYHLNHRAGGVVMFDPNTGTMLEGIGHYGYESTGPRSARMVCPNPYPCDFDRGIITAIARKFEPTAQVTLDTSAPCRKDGADSSTYLISW